MSYDAKHRRSNRSNTPLPELLQGHGDLVLVATQTQEPNELTGPIYAALERQHDSYTR